MSKPLGFEVCLSVPFDQAVGKVVAALREEGFGVVTQVDLQAAFKDKLGTSFPPYVILGACNPSLAHRVLESHPEMGLLLPCNVTVEGGTGGEVRVRVVDPARMMEIADVGADAAMAEVGHEAGERLRRVTEKLGQNAAEEREPR